MIKISKRLEAISSLVPINSKVIDIGCDHALLDIYLIQNNNNLKIIEIHKKKEKNTYFNLSSFMKNILYDFNNNNILNHANDH